MSERDPVLPEVASARLMELQALQRKISVAANKKTIGQTFDVLVEGNSPREPNLLFGRTSTFKGVHFEGAPNLIGQTIPVHIYQAFTSALRGELRSF